MRTGFVRHRILAALGLSSTVFAACSANEGGSTPIPTSGPSVAGTETAARLDPTTAPVPGTATEPIATATPIETAPPASPPVDTSKEWQPTVLPKLEAMPLDTHPEVSTRCPEGEFCVTEAHSKGGKPASAPFQKCAVSLNKPGPRHSGERSTTFDEAQTQRERTQIKDACCYDWISICPGGRPLLVDGRPRLAPDCQSSDWVAGESSSLARATSIADVSERDRRALAEHYTREATFEHASIAAFARVSLSLLAVGAPPHLLVDTHRAGLDEIAHAEAMYRMASAWSGSTVGPEALDLTGAVEIRSSLVDLAEEAFFEGAVGEVVASLVLREESERAPDLETRSILGTMAADEENHAELAWRTVAWALSRDDASVRSMLEGSRNRITTEIAGPIPLDAPGAALPFVTSASERTLVRRRALVEIVLPCLDALLGERPSSERSTAGALLTSKASC